MTSLRIGSKMLLMVAAMFSFVSCGSSEPEWSDPEAHEKTEQLRAQYGPLIVGTWHVESVGEQNRFFERITFKSDGTVSGLRMWQTRSRVTVDGKEVLTDWEDMPDLAGTYSGTWSLQWERTETGQGGCNRLRLYVPMDNSDVMAYPNASILGTVNADSLQLSGHYLGYMKGDKEGWITFYHGDAEPSF